MGPEAANFSNFFIESEMNLLEHHCRFFSLKKEVRNSRNRSGPGPLGWFLAAALFAQPGNSGEPVPMAGLLAGLEYGKPILGIHAPLDGGPGPDSPGNVKIARASLEPSGQGIWKNALKPKLVLDDFRMEGNSSQILSFLNQIQQGWPAGVEIRGMQIRWQTSSLNLLSADKVLFEEAEIYLENGWIKTGAKRKSLTRLDSKIFQP